MIFTVVMSVLLINCVMAEIDFSEKEKEINKFVQGGYHGADYIDILKQGTQITTELDNALYEAMESTKDSNPDSYLNVVDNVLDTILIINSLIDKMEPKTEWGKMFKIFISMQVEIAQKEMKQAKETYQGNDVNYINLEETLKEMIKLLLKFQEHRYELQKSDISLMKESMEVIKLADNFSLELGVQEPSNEVSQILVKAFSLIMKATIAYLDYLLLPFRD